MPRKATTLFTCLLCLCIILSACTPPQPSPIAATPTAAAAQSNAEVLISQVLTGIEGNNNLEWIELYNRTGQAVNLKGWSLWYRLPTSDKDLSVYRWSQTAFIPPHGHFLLGRSGEPLATAPDAEFEQPLNLSGGGLVLRQPGETAPAADALGWGNAPLGFFEGAPVANPVNGSSFERLPGGEKGHGTDTDSNIADFVQQSQPVARNSGSQPVPPEAKRLALRLEAPAQTPPGKTFEITLTAENQTGQEAKNLVFTLPLPALFTPQNLPSEVTGKEITSGEKALLWNITSLPAGETRQIKITLLSAWAFAAHTWRSYFLSAENWQTPAFGGPAITRIEGGKIPIDVARTLNNAELTLEGVASMYTGGYFAGSGNNKFYLQDETHGIQVQVFGGQGQVSVKIGDRVRVRGKVSIYRDAVQISPIKVPGDVEVLGKDKAPAPTPATLQQALTEKTSLPGKVIQVEGLITRIEEFSYSYEIDLVDPAGSGNPLTLYVDKQANISIDALETGKQLRAVGILEARDGKQMLYPREQADLNEIYPPIVRIEAQAPITVQSGEAFTTTLKVFNHLPQALKDVKISVPLSPTSAQFVSASAGGQSNGQAVTWVISQLEPNGGSASVSYQQKVLLQQGAVPIQNYTASAADLKEPATGLTRYAFVGGSVPIWAIQGASYRSPYVGELLTTQGVVTGVFPQLGGFFLQSTDPDKNPNTSEGLFISLGGAKLKVEAGNKVEVKGVVRENAQQTALMLDANAGLKILEEKAALPEAVELDPPASLKEANPYMETLEGMLVKVSQAAVAVAPTSHYGEFVLVQKKWNKTRLFQGQDNGAMIMVDDGSNATYYERTGLPYVVRTGDQVSELIGPLAYTYSRYKIEPVKAPKITTTPLPQPAIQEAAAGEISLMTWNTLNLFDISDPHPSDPPRATASQYQRDQQKVANTILAAGAPLVVGLQEVENIKILENIAQLPSLAPYQYKPVLVEGSDSRGIDVGYLVRGDRAKIIESKAYPDPNALFSRPPLMIHVQVGETDLYVFNNHFLSMSEGVLATEARRTAQAAYNLKLVQEIQAKNPQALVAVIGDLNSFYESLPIETFRQGGLKHVFDKLPPEQRFTYVYQGESQTLDHILVSAPLYEKINRVEVLHVNADFPPTLADDTSPFSKSDHDPVIITLKGN